MNFQNTWNGVDAGVIFCHWPYEDLTFLPQLSPLFLPDRVSCSVILCSSSPSLTRFIVVSHRVLWFCFLDTICLEFTSRLHNLLDRQMQYLQIISFFLFLPPSLCFTIVKVVTCSTPIGGLTPTTFSTLSQALTCLCKPLCSQFRLSFHVISCFCCPTISLLVAWCSLGVICISFNKYYGF